MGPIESSIPTILDKMRGGNYKPKSGVPIPIEEVYSCNFISEDMYKAILLEWETSRKASRNKQAIDDMSMEAARLNDRMKRCGVPSRFLNAIIDKTYEHDLASGGWVYVCGPDSDAVLNKACAILKGWVVANDFGTARFEYVTAILSQMRDVHTEIESMRVYTTAGLLLVAGLGTEPPTDWALSKLWELFASRSNNGLPTIIATRDTPDELVSHLGSRGADLATGEIMQVLMSRSKVVQV